jgi:hypothetical protein
MDDTNNPDSYSIGSTVGADTDTTSSTKAAADSAVGSNPTSSVKGSKTGPDTIKVRVGTGALYTEDSVTKVTDSPKLVNASTDTTCQDCLNQIQVGVAGSGASLYARRENNVLLFKSLQVEGALTLRYDSGTLILGGSAAVPALDIILSSKGNLADRKNKFLAVNDAGDGIAYVDAPTSDAALGKFTELTDVPALAPNVGKVLTVNNLGNGVVWTTITQFDGQYSSLTGKPTYATVASTGAYADLTGKPTLFSGSYLDLTNKPVLSSFSGAYADLTGKPTLFSGAYADLTGAPTPVTKLAQLSDVPAMSTGANKVLGVNAAGTAYVWVTPSSGGTGGVSRFVDLTDAPTFVNNASKYMRLNSAGTALEFATISWTDVANRPTLALVAVSGSYGDLSGKPTLSTVAGSGLYADLTGKPSIPTRFTQLLDAPLVAGNAGKVLAVTSSESGFEWVSLPTAGTGSTGGTGTTGATKFIQLTDAPTSFSGAGGKTVRVNAAASALEFVASTLVGHTDFPSSYSGNAGKGLRVNTAGTALEFYTLPTSSFDGTYASLTGKPTLSAVSSSGLYADLVSKPTFATVATSGLYADLLNRPVLPTKISDLDVPAYSSANANKVLAQNSAGNGLTWVALPAAGSSGATALTGLSDVAISSPSSGQVLLQ